MAQLPLDTSCQAEYSDGFILDETDNNDVGQFGNKNIFYDILEKLPEVTHGRMVRFTVFYKNNRYDIDWRTLPDNARPIRFRNGFIAQSTTGEVSQGWSGMRFGYQYNDDTGKNIKEVMEL